ncbi:putative secreted protein [Cryptosporidium canis]|uniref:Secreted protein n=1 Tax=Cryptosporidium canis TaxID=195482 RepID=A0A9D5HYK5_9CRYT|nr:putative secreted protein [Cryptosporidium canis]
MRHLSISSIIVVNVAVFLLLISKISSISNSDFDVASKESEVTYNRQNGLSRFIDTAISLTKYELKTLIEKKEYIFSTYLEPYNQVTSLNNDVDEHKEHFWELNLTEYKQVFHIPMELKSLLSFSQSSQVEHTPESAVRNYFFPRLKHFKKDLPELAPEPYQRVMGFAIEVCMLPTVWYIELVHCIYVSASSYFDGALMSYSLQDLVGSAIVSMDFRNEQFSMENCVKYLPLFSDNKISSRFREICGATKSCIETRAFQTNNFSNFKSEFNNRIQEVYRVIPHLSGALDPITFSRYSMLYSLSILLKTHTLSKNLPERNFLPVRIMVASLGYYALSEKLNMKFSTENLVVTFFTKLITSILFEKTDVVIKRCSEEIIKFAELSGDDLSEFFQGFCKEIFSIGFIDESFQNFAEIDSKFIASTHPKRVLLNSYALVVPEMFHELPFSEYNSSWIHFNDTDKDFPKYPDQLDVDSSVQGFNATLDDNLNSTQNVPSDEDFNFTEPIKKSTKKRKIKSCISIQKSRRNKKKSTKSRVKKS